MKTPQDFLKTKPENIPDELKQHDQWVVWKAVPRDDKITKVPYDPKTGKNAKANDPSTWASFDKAWEAYESGGYTGIGFVLTEGDPFCGWDLDHCRDSETGHVEDWAMDIVHKLQGYTEVSPSGTGLRIIVKAKLPPGGRKKGNTEVYESSRYLTMTGHAL